MIAAKNQTPAPGAPEANPPVPPAPKFKMEGPLDPTEHLKKIQCPKGHRAWTPPVAFIIDSQAFAARCKDCDKWHFLRPGMDTADVAPSEWIAEVGLETGKDE